MTFERYPHSATVSYVAPGTKSATGVVTPGTLATVSISKCRVEVNNSRFVIGENGERIEYALSVICPLLSGVDSIPNGAKLSCAGKTYTVVEIPPLQTHTLIRCK